MYTFFKVALINALLIPSTYQLGLSQEAIITEAPTPPAPPSVVISKSAKAPKAVVIRKNSNWEVTAATPEEAGIDMKDVKSKEVSMVVPVSKNADIFIDNNSRPFEIKTWDEPKVKVVTTIYYEGDADKLSDENWFEKLNLSVKALGSSVKIKSGTVNGGGSYSYGGQVWNWSSGGADGVAIFNGSGENIGTKSSLKRVVTVYVPKDNKLDIESKYADVNILTNLNKVHVDITNGNLETQDINTLLLRSKYGNVSLGNVKLGEIEFINGRLSAKDAGELDIDTKYSSVEMASLQKGTIRSTNDEYEIEEVGNIQGRKNYGNLRITKLTGSIDLDGTNADVKIRNIAASTDVIKIDNKYADLRLPLRDVKNYSITYNGPYSTVYSNFEKKPWKPVAENKTDNNGTKEKEELLALKQLKELKDLKISGQFNFNGEDDLNSRFTAIGGTGKGTKIDIKCQNCTVDFK